MLFGFAATNEPPNNPQSVIDPDDELVEEESVGEEINKTLVALMPWGISILFHVALVVVAFFLVWQTIVQGPEEQPVIPASRLSDTPGAPVEIDQVEEQSAETPMTVPTPTDVTTPSPTISETTIPTQIMGQRFQGGMQGGPLGNTTGTGLNFKGPFGQGGNARRIAFVVDASGSMVDVLPFVINELKKVVNELKPAQEITIIFFSGEGVYEVPGGGRASGLRSCTPKFKEDIRKWVSLENFAFETGGRGSKHVQDAILKALRYEPELVFLLSDNLTGGGQGATQHEIFQADLMDAIREANDHTPQAKFKTIQFLYEDPLVRAGLTGTLQLLADETGGTYRFIGESDLHLAK